MYIIRLRIIFMILLLLAAAICFGQENTIKYRVRAINGIYYIPDTAYAGYPFQVYSPYLTDSTMWFSLHNDHYRFCVLTSPQQTCDLLIVPGQYKWELIYKYDSDQWRIDEGRIFVK